MFNKYSYSISDSLHVARFLNFKHTNKFYFINETTEAKHIIWCFQIFYYHQFQIDPLRKLTKANITDSLCLSI